MKINDVCIYRFDIPVREPFTIATMTTTVSPNVLVGICTECGLVGWGEGSPLHAIVGETQSTCLAAALDMKPLLIGRDPRDVRVLADELEAFLPHNTTIRSAFDMALNDLAAQAAGMPLFRFLGGAARPLPTDMTVPIGEKEDSARKAANAVAKGFKTIKTKVGKDAVADVERLKAIKEAIGPSVGLRIDANQGWTPVEAVKTLEAMAGLGIEFCEQPLRAHDLAGLRWVRERSPIPVMADESVFSPIDALRVANEGAADFINIKLSKAGSIVRSLQVAAIARAANMQCMVGCMLESRLGLTGTAHFAAAVSCANWFDLDSFFDHAEDPVEGGVTFADGCIYLPEEPGLGARPTEDALKQYERVG